MRCFRSLKGRATLEVVSHLDGKRVFRNYLPAVGVHLPNSGDGLADLVESEAIERWRDDVYEFCGTSMILSPLSFLTWGENVSSSGVQTLVVSTTCTPDSTAKHVPVSRFREMHPIRLEYEKSH